MQEHNTHIHVFEVSDMENVWLTRQNENVWTYKIGLNPAYLAQSKKKLALCVLLSIVIIIVALFVWSAISALFGAFFAVLILPLLEVITVLTYSVSLVTKKEETVTIDRSAGINSTQRQHWRGREETQEYPLKDFTTVTCSQVTTTPEYKHGTTTSTYYTVSLHDEIEPFEIFCARDKSAARDHARELADFLALRYRDETPV